MIFPFALLAALALPPETNPHAMQEQIDPARVHTYDRQEIALPDFPAASPILDIGGGGEAIIGRLKGARVVAIDLYSWGLRRTPPGPLKIVMDATDLMFLDASFPSATSFFTLMYMQPEQQEKALKEAYRVLTPGGRLYIWDVELPVFPFTFRLPKETVTTSYGTKYPKQPQGLAWFTRLARQTGFTVVETASEGNTFRLVLQACQDG
jgi:ubiquinone/menaquinone biosynthesis C-methylase UbiE